LKALLDEEVYVDESSRPNGYYMTLFHQRQPMVSL